MLYQLQRPLWPVCGLICGNACNALASQDRTVRVSVIRISDGEVVDSVDGQRRYSGGGSRIGEACAGDARYDRASGGVVCGNGEVGGNGFLEITGTACRKTIVTSLLTMVFLLSLYV